MNIIQTAGLTTLFFILSGIIYYKLKDNPHSLKWMTKILLFMSGILLFLNTNLYIAAQDQVRTTAVIQKYSETATLELMALLHDTAHHTVYAEGNRIHIDKDTDNERVFILMHDPIFSILDQAKTVEMTKELNP